MKTTQLVDLLARGTAPGAGPSLAAGWRMALALLAGLASSALVLALLYGVREDLAAQILQPLFWLKLAFPLALLPGALTAAVRLAHPGRRLGQVRASLLLPALALWLAGAIWLAITPTSLRAALLLGQSWEVCSLNVALLSLPALAAMLWYMRGLAPTRLPAAGAIAGLVAGALGVLVYSLYCVEMAPPFWGIWYVLGMLAPTALGAVSGPLLLRW